VSERASEWVTKREREREREGETWSDNDDGVTMMIMMITTAMRFVCPRRDARDVRGEQHRAPFPKGLFPTSRQTRTCWCTRTHVVRAHTTTSTLSQFFHHCLPAGKPVLFPRTSCTHNNQYCVTLFYHCLPAGKLLGVLHT
jgi:hypothetical protein